MYQYDSTMCFFFLYNNDRYCTSCICDIKLGPVKYMYMYTRDKTVIKSKMVKKNSTTEIYNLQGF